MPYMLMQHEVDPAKKLIEEVGDLSTVELFNNQILVGVYLRPEKTQSGLYMPDKHRDEDRFQSKVGLILKMGPRAFEPNSDGWFDGETFALHDWVVSRPANGWSITVHGVLCRILRDTQVEGRVKNPDEVW
jgi:co-chaperonin GroES (HSP10)